jgi:hypothetical protein
LQLISYAHDNIIMNSKIPEAAELCHALEICFFYGAKTNELGGTNALWSLLERLENTSPPCIPLRNAVGAVASMSSLRTSMAKARGWIRQILNTKGGLDASISVMINSVSPGISPNSSGKSDLLSAFYYSFSVLYHRDDALILVSFLAYV